MKRFVSLIALIFIAGWLTGYVLFGKGSLRDRAMAAYNAGEYQKALPLFKEYGQTPEVRKNLQEQQVVLAYMMDIEKKLSLGADAGASATAPAQSGDLMAQAMSFALQQKSNANDPPSGADRVPHKKPAAGQVVTMTIKELGNFEFDANVQTDVPADVKLLDGARVRLNGFMMPLNQAEKINYFALVPSLVGCCFGAPPGVQHIITCRTEPDKGLDYALDEVYVEGILHVKVSRSEGYTNNIFDLEVTGAKVK